MDEPTPRPLGNPIPGSAPKRRGRPPGSVSLTPEIQATIVGLIREGVFPYGAASIAGISRRTLDDWIARGEGRHPTRPSTPKLRAFAREVRIARALVRIDAETRVYREKPKMWLRNSARSTQHDDGWTAPPRGRHRAPEGRWLLELIDELDGADQKKEPQKRRGRPPGSVSLTDEIQRTIVAFTRAGAFAVSAAEAAGISRSTYFDWMARGEDRHATRPGTPKLRRFGTEVRRAQADARGVEEARVLKDDPFHWLRYAARTEGEAIGWSEPRPGEEERGESDLRPGELLGIWAQELFGQSRAPTNDQSVRPPSEKEIPG
jgi:transposase-like protein